jgi:uncharacterized protein YecE (DUF72 family)
VSDVLAGSRPVEGILATVAFVAPGLFVGTAGWSIPRASATCFPGDGSHLHRYSRVLTCAEINSSFHRAHAFATYERWAASAPETFRFSVKVPRAISHDLRLRRSRRPFERLLAESAGLGDRRGPFLLQLPPSFGFDRRVVTNFLDIVRSTYAGGLVCEPRHASWFEPAVDRLLATYRVARVAADPAPAPGAATPGGWDGLAYFRLHGSPRKYWSQYQEACLSALASTLLRLPATTEVWCVFDNTASGAAAVDALTLQRLHGMNVGRTASLLQ